MPDRLLELHGTGIGPLPPISTALRAVGDEDVETINRIFGFNGYKFGYWKSAKPVDGIDVSESDTRLGILRGVLKVYCETAYQQVLKEYPELAAKEAEIVAERKGRRSEELESRSESFSRFTRPSLP